MRKLLLALVLAGMATCAWATPDYLWGGALVGHSIDVMPYTTSPPVGGWCAEYASHAVSSFEELDTELPWHPFGNIWYVLAAWETESKIWCGTEFGFGNYDSSVYGFLEFFPCYPVGGLEIATSDWPGPNEGTAFVTTGTPWSGNWVPVYWFGGYSYPPSYGATVMPISVDPPTNFCGFSNCQNPPISYAVEEAQRGAMGVNMPGMVPVWPEQPGPWACCLPQPSGTCVMLLEQECLTLGGTWLGEGVTCEPVNPCLQPGACCIGGICEVMMEEGCTLVQGTFMGVGTTCTPNPCEAVCCFQLPTSPHGCEIMLEDACAAAGGFWRPEGTSCNPNPCEIYTPTENTSWGKIKDMYR